MPVLSIVPEPHRLILVVIDNESYEHSNITIDDNKPDGACLKDTFDALSLFIDEKQPTMVYILKSSRDSESHTKIKIEGIAQLVCEIRGIRCKLFSNIKVKNLLKKDQSFFPDHYGTATATPKYIIPALVLPFLS